MKLLSYSETLKAGKAAIGDMLIPLRVNRARKQAELEMCKLDEDIANNEAALQAACCEEEINFNRIIEMQDRLGLLERRRKQFEKIINEMFPVDTK